MNVLFEPALGTGDSDLELDPDEDFAGAEDLTDAGTEEAGAAGLGASDGGAAGVGNGVGFDPPMLREMVGGGGGASVWGCRSMGGGRGWEGSAACWGARKPPGTKEKAFALSLLMATNSELVATSEESGYR